MNIDKSRLLYDDAGTKIYPQSSSDWRGWVSASDTRNFLLDDPLVDWLELYGVSRGFTPDDELLTYDSRLDFASFLLAKGNEFESAVHAWMSERAEVETVGGYESIRDLVAAERTVDAMLGGRQVLYQPVLRNPENQTYGLPDFIVRLDVLMGMFPGLREVEERLGGLLSDVPLRQQYRILDSKFSTLGLLKDGSVGADQIGYKVQLDIYNRALGRLVGTRPPVAYLLGRSWRRGQNERGTSAVELLGPVDMFGDAKRGVPLQPLTDAAVAWRRKVVEVGEMWNLSPIPSVPELYPNMSNSEDGPWHQAKAALATDLGELTRITQITPIKRNDAIASGILDIDDEACTATALGVTGPKLAPLETQLSI